MLAKGLVFAGSALGGAGIYGFLLYEFPWTRAGLCLAAAAGLIAVGGLLGAKFESEKALRGAIQE